MRDLIDQLVPQSQSDKDLHENVQNRAGKAMQKREYWGTNSTGKQLDSQKVFHRPLAHENISLINNLLIHAMVVL
jgi:hypothetical protein